MYGGRKPTAGRSSTRTARIRLTPEPEERTFRGGRIFRRRPLRRLRFSARTAYRARKIAADKIQHGFLIRLRVGIERITVAIGAREVTIARRHVVVCEENLFPIRFRRDRILVVLD